MGKVCIVSRFILTAAAFFISLHGNSQETRFERFLDSLNVYARGEERVGHPDEQFEDKGYSLKWMTIDGSYGGSQYCCGGKIYEIKSSADTLLSGQTLEELYSQSFTGTFSLSAVLTPRTGWPEVVERSYETIGERYVISLAKYPEPLPTSAMHFIVVVRYYERIPH